MHDTVLWDPVSAFAGKTQDRLIVSSFYRFPIMGGGVAPPLRVYRLPPPPPPPEREAPELLPDEELPEERPEEDEPLL